MEKERPEGDKAPEWRQRWLLVPSANPTQRTFWLLRQSPTNNSDEELSAYRNRLEKTQLDRRWLKLKTGGILWPRETVFPLAPRKLLFSTLGYREQYDWELVVGDRLNGGNGNSEISTEESKVARGAWSDEISNILKNPKLAIPLSHLIREFYYHLRSSPLPVYCPPDSGIDAETGATEAPDTLAKLGKCAPEPQLVSALIIQAFNAHDSRLSFDAPRLRQFLEALRVYRYLLDGKVIPRSPEGRLDRSGASLPPFLDRLLDLSKPAAQILWGAVFLFVLSLLATPVSRAGSGLARAFVNRRYLTLQGEAEEFLEELGFRSSQESSAVLALRGLNLGRKQTRAARDFTLPGLTARYIAFIEKVRNAYNGKVVIVIDEMDKVDDPQEVKALLTEIKGALFAPGTFYLISIAEDAARSFRRRLASGRDIFESTFDDVLDIARMDVANAVAILERLEETTKEEHRLPAACLTVAALFGGGIPREIIRARRTLSLAMADQANAWQILSFGMMKQTDNAMSAWAARVLLQEELKKWETHLGETNLSGKDTIEIWKHSREARKVFEAGKGDNDAYGAVWKEIQSCIEVIDPKGSCRSAGYLSYASDSDEPESANGGQAEYRRIVSDLQMVLRLLILTHLCERIARGEESKAYEGELLACHRALADKPALAGTLLEELRKNRVSTDCRGNLS
uniref:KAP family P-loop domain-containing protein n=1 Tax=Candidatus Kentrum sp. UNK TaxID=2126344 RepID=A0A451B150_9GAMM|nr:MAG: hypothetical protein BECKUNK1418G_GA0071005_10903 [Candidatus Kentron sp. UNK]VFK72006.1 MAG: hypothetical protein BECKUNK1418H_GA0071006_10914 [Candidatus Kentron sp. UNK]